MFTQNFKFKLWDSHIIIETVSNFVAISIFYQYTSQMANKYIYNYYKLTVSNFYTDKYIIAFYLTKNIYIIAFLLIKLQCDTINKTTDQG